MMDELWWERWPEVLARETAALDAAGIAWHRDEATLAKGVMRLAVNVATAVGNQELFIVYPDSYPYFRCQVYAPGLDLAFHQNPFERNLCLIGRRTHYWDTDRTAADLISEQLPKLLMSAFAADPAAVAGIEEPHAEPFSDFYPYPPSMILIESDWSIGPEHRSGTLRMGALRTSEQLPDPLIRGAVLDVRSESGEVLCAASPSLRRAFSGKEFEGRWGRVQKPIHIAHEGQFIKELLQQHPRLRDAKPTHVKGGWLRVWGVLFPEQTAHRVMGEGWVFACAVDANCPHVTNVPQPHFGKSQPQQKHKHKHKKRGRR